MSELATVPPATVHLPPAVRSPKLVQGIGFAVSRRMMMRRLSRRYGNVFTLRLPMWGRVIMVSDPQLAKQIFTTSPDELGNIQPNLSRLFGPGSVFGLEGDDHRRRRRLLAPPFHGKSMKNYESIIEEETLREMAGWPEGSPFATLPPMMRITLNAILRAVFGAEGAELDELRRLIPPWVTLGSRLAALPKPKRYPRFGPWGRLDKWRRQYDIVIEKLIAAERADPDFAERTDVLALLLRSTYDDGSTMSHKDIGDELLALLAAGHETTASTLAWAFERISRHPELLARLVEEADGPVRAATSCAKRRSSRCNGPGPSSISPVATSTPMPTGSANGRSRAAIRSSSASRRYTTTPTCSPIRGGSTRNASPTPNRRRCPGSRSAAGPAAASARRSPTWKWTSCSGPCCAT